MEANNEVFTFTPFKSFVHTSFWHKLAEIKLEIDKLSDKARPIFGYYTNVNSKSCLLEVDYSSFNKDFKPPINNYICHGVLYNKNTVEEFKQCNKIDIMRHEGESFISDMRNGKILDDPSLLSRFFILSFADLKTHKFYYWFAFPCPMLPVSQLIKKQVLSSEMVEQLSILYEKTNYKNRMFFIVVKEEHNYQRYNLNDYISLNPEQNFKSCNMNNFYFCFIDPSEYETPGWTLRAFMALLYITCPNIHGQILNFIGIRFSSLGSCDASKQWHVKLAETKKFVENLNFVGWELNLHDKMGPRLTCLEDSMDGKRLAENSLLLNLKLMKWRLLTDLDLEAIARTKCLLLGAGTLGCAVSRSLLAWGFKNISFIDNGIVRYSNPVRQSLYIHEDAVDGNKPKATTAAARLVEINPNTISNGYVLQIQMPGHTVGDCLREDLIKDLKLIENLCQEYDVIFLLTDSRESRWLPTVLGTFYKKIVINVALGFDSYLVMRHGSNIYDNITTIKPEDINDLKCINGADLGCYFCQDITAPGDSMKDRTLDQQCTVTRPGVSNIASSYAVELLVALLHHKDKNSAPAYFSLSGKSQEAVPEGYFGILPHSIRGTLGTFENIMPATRKFSQCIACSDIILNEYRNRNIDFLLDVFNSAQYLLDLTGISEFEDLDNNIIECDDDDWEE
ncbi:ubiquitin-like modifier-activating enzyme atg7 isoform X2 [Condylostylus longicornis]|nr:ubiquitin-like modifier-activating enzyme atg7 isoform X2 [Condylostylus longicornis]